MMTEEGEIDLLRSSSRVSASRRQLSATNLSNYYEDTDNIINYAVGMSFGFSVALCIYNIYLMLLCYYHC